MQDEKDKTGGLPEERELMSLVELQKFLADEISEIDSKGRFERAFTPLTEGLGFHHEGKRAKEPSVTTRRKRSPVDALFEGDETRLEPAILESDPSLGNAKETPPTPTRSRLASFLDEPTSPPPSEALIAKVQTPAQAKAPAPKGKRPEPTEIPRPKIEKVLASEPTKFKAEVSEPPPVPDVSLFRRLFAGVADQIFIWFLWAVAVFLTFRLMNMGIGPDLDPVSPSFVRFAVLEFVTLWMAYLFVSLGLLDMTFGMWAWGMRVRFGPGKKEAIWMRKFIRIFAAFLILAPVVPVVVLAIQIHGRNLIDWLSSSRVYRTSIE